MRNKLTSLILVAALASGCATSPTGRSQLVLLPESQMDKMGLQAFTNIKQKTPVDSNRTTNKYVQCVGKAITREVGGSWEIVVFRDDAANAFALPGRKIGVNTGLLKVAENQDQLATVIGHEVAHVLSQHSNERVSQQFAVDQGLGLVTALASPQSATGQTLMGLLGVGAEYGILMPYSRVQESEADILGLDLMAQGRASIRARASICGSTWAAPAASATGVPVHPPVAQDAHQRPQRAHGGRAESAEQGQAAGQAPGVSLRKIYTNV